VVKAVNTRSGEKILLYEVKIIPLRFFVKRQNRVRIGRLGKYKLASIYAQ